ncbi:MAG: hypothetical protein G01um101430_462 [Parcubacteria group bacterium Gr01-1014_30]|nr:MAG: hypothetical protein G01um101430_462 [Parcubacteria group bacterium Gr01-1014_30]
MILKVFIWGALSAIPAVFIELGFFEFSLPTLINIFAGVALVEEVLKYIVVKVRVFFLSIRELDEPLDIMLYFVIAALGFATLENMLLFLSPDVLTLGLRDTFALASFRFISATFLHALASGVLGFFLALSYSEMKKRTLFTSAGFFTAVLLHGLYNRAIMIEDIYTAFSVTALLIAASAVFVLWAFRKLKKMPSVCLPR